jgi:hypothetical protein
MHTAQQLRVNAGNIGAILSKGYVNASNGRDIPVRAFGDFMSDPMNPVWRLPVKLPADVSAANRFNY